MGGLELAGRRPRAVRKAGGRREVGGACLVVYLGSQRSVLAVVILLAIASGEGGAVLVRELAVGCAVFAGGEENTATPARGGEREKWVHE